MVTKSKLIRKQNQVLSAHNQAMGFLEELSILASEAYGEDLDAFLCNGGEIEFRLSDDPDGLNGDRAIRLEDVIDSLNARKQEPPMGEESDLKLYKKYENHG